MFTGGLGLVVVGVGIAGYYGWKYFSSQTGDTGTGRPDVSKIGPDNFYGDYQWNQ